MNLTPAASPSSTASVVRSQAALEWRLMMSNGEQILLTLVIPIVLLVGLATTSFVSLGVSGRDERLNLLVPGIVALAVMSSAFTALAIATGFDRRSEAIKFLGTTPLSRTGLLAAKSLAVLGIEVIQIAAILTVAVALGWRPGGAFPAALVFVALGTAAFASLGLALAGVLRAEATLAAANAIYVILLLAGGVVIPADRLPHAMAVVVSALPSAALADGLRVTLGAMDGGQLLLSTLVLLAWTAAGSLLVHRFFRWTS